MFCRRGQPAEDSPRQSYRVFPGWTSRFWTWLTGVPEKGQKPFLRPTPSTYASLAVFTYVLGLSVGVASFRFSGVSFVAILLTGWVMTVNGARRMISTVAHQCVHAAFSGDRQFDMKTAELFAMLTLTQTAADYRREHFELHHRHDVFTSFDDPAARLLWNAGFRPGRSIRRLWWNLLLTTGSLRFHGQWFAGRIASQGRGRVTWRRLGALLAMCAVLSGLTVLSSVHAVILGAVFPVIVLYQTSVLLEFISEHAWFVAPNGLARKRYIHGTHSWGRFCGRKVPTKGRRHGLLWAIASTLWVVEHLAYHLPVRLVILPGDLSQHDFHHRKPATPDWTTAAYAREEDRQNGDRRWPEYREFWGLHNAINEVFRGIASSTAISARDE